MKLKDWLSKENKIIADMARDLNLTHTAVRYWVEGLRCPRPYQMQKIVTYTKGEVTANDFYGVEE